MSVVKEGLVFKRYILKRYSFQPQSHIGNIFEVPIPNASTLAVLVDTGVIAVMKSVQYLDSIKGKKYLTYPTEIQKGILLHRQIDTQLK